MAKVLREVVTLDKIVPGGQTLGALADGRKVFVWGGLPGETVEVEVYKTRKSYAESNVVKVIQASHLRTKPRDECYLSTSPWQVYDFDYENELKNELVIEAFKQAKIDLQLPPIRTDGRDFNYRNKMEYSLWFDKETEKISLAFRKRGTHQKLPVTSSSIERPEIFAEAQRVVDGLNARNADSRQYQSLVVRCDQQGKVSSALFENGKSHPHMESLTDKILGKEFTYSPNGFFQINLPVYEMALQKMREFIDQNLKTVDLYSGVGSISLTISDAPILVEINKFAAGEAEENKEALGLNSAVTVCASAEQSLDYITSDVNLIVDPPRAGLDDAVTERILQAKPPRIIYLSCNPTTQARDVSRLLAGYQIIHSQAYNFFPRTPHIENLVVLELVG
jgi:23S rRNA (uracil1939-C5)-methyltransferase